MELAQYRKERRALISAIKKLVKPHLWPSGYVVGNKEPLKLWVPKDAVGNFTHKRFKLRSAFVAKEFEGFADDGVITDSYGGGIVTLFYEDIPLEDLFYLRNWAERYFANIPKPVKKR